MRSIFAPATWSTRSRASPEAFLKPKVLDRNTVVLSEHAPKWRYAARRANARLQDWIDRGLKTGGLSHFLTLRFPRAQAECPKSHWYTTISFRWAELSAWLKPCTTHFRPRRCIRP